jgi:hypothetical protein
LEPQTTQTEERAVIGTYPSPEAQESQNQAPIRYDTRGRGKDGKRREREREREREKREEREEINQTHY